MALSVIRFDLRAPNLSPADTQRLYSTALEMTAYAEEKGFEMCVLSEHHASPDGFLPSPLVMAAAVVASTKAIPVNIAALLVPLHDPVRIAEDIAVLDNIAKGRVSFVAGLGYRPVEYAMFERDWKGRGKLLDECLETMIQAWTGEPFEYKGQTVQVLPRPFTQPHPMIFIGGSGKKAAERAARYGMSFFPATGDQSLVDLYHAECERLGTTPGMVALPEGPGTVFVSEDPDKTWAEIGDHLLHDATTYHSWQTEDIRSHVHSQAETVDALRAEGVYQILTPDECVATAQSLSFMGAITHHPLCGAAPSEHGWASLELYADKVLPRLRGEA